MFGKWMLWRKLNSVPVRAVSILRAPGPDDVLFVEMDQREDERSVRMLSEALDDALPCRVVVLSGVRVSAFDPIGGPT